MLKQIVTFLTLILTITAAHITQANNANIIAGNVIHIIDGDTIKIIDKNNKTFKVRLAEIDAPEINQPYGKKSKQALQNLVSDKNIKVIQSTTDKYGRIVGHIVINKTNINTELIKNGYAWVYGKYSKSKNYKILETNAKINKLGLWSLKKEQRIAPWKWRKLKRKKNEATTR